MQDPQNPTEQAVEQTNAEAAPASQETTQPAPATEQPAPAQEVKHPSVIFREKYQALVAETGHSISVEPKYIKRDDGTYSTTLETTVQPVK